VDVGTVKNPPSPSRPVDEISTGEVEKAMFDREEGVAKPMLIEC
jgi:hypothetical protein